MRFADFYIGKHTARGSRPVTAPAGRGAIAVVALAMSTPAFAYIDPGTGSIILQSLLAGIAVAIGVLRSYWHRIRSFFSSAHSGTDPGSRETEQKADAGSGR